MFLDLRKLKNALENKKEVVKLDDSAPTQGCWNLPTSRGAGGRTQSGVGGKRQNF